MGGMRRFRGALPWLMATVLVSLMLAPSPSALQASSHRDAPLITEDPAADNTDVYAFVSTESGRQDFVTLISNWIPFEEPTEGPNYYRFSDNVLYKIAVVANDGGSLKPVLTYLFRFHTTVVNGNTFLYNTGLIGVPPNPSAPTSQYTNLNIRQSYTLTEVRADGTRTVLLRGARVAPINVGPNSTGACGIPPTAANCAHYVALANAAVHTIPGTGGMRVFAGPRADMFYVDLMGAFDLLGGFTNEVRNPGVNSTAGFNIHSIALEIPKSRLDSVAAHGIIGVWSSSSRLRMPVLSQGQVPSDQGDQDESIFVQVSRLGNPLVNEVLIPLQAKDQFNQTTPSADESQFANFIVNPGSSQGPLALVSLIKGVLGCTAANGRADLQAALLTGIPLGVVSGFPGNFTGPTRADLLRLNYTVAPTAVDPNNPGNNRLGLLAGDIAGFPNGRRPFDDVVDIELKAVGGVLQPLVGLPSCDSAGNLTDNVDGPGSANPFLTTFPYLGIPHQGFGETN